MEVVFTKKAWEDYVYWQSTDMKMVKRVNSLIKDILCTPFSGIGKPEPLKFDMASFWSRRIDDEHRLVYKILEDRLVIHQCRYHY
ncbi:MAG: toxin YoeB [Alphaproteobacteria bacterium 41-28]|mgnify:CR=1 FL=1|nr:MAG: toxin YoeB [Alphaproteobacteria bacterium 41-28]